MKLGAREIDAFLKTPDRQTDAVLIYGPDGGLVRERARIIATAIVGEHADPLSRMEFTGDQIKADPPLLRDELSAMTLMGGRRVIIIRGAHDKAAPVIAGALAGLATPTYLIVEAEELAPSGALRALFEKEPRLAALACYRDEGRHLEESIRGTLAHAGLRPTPDAVHYLAAHLGNDRGVTQNELEKIILYMGQDKEVTLEIAQGLSGHNATETIDDICHAVASGNGSQAHMLLEELLHEGTQPVVIVRSLIRHFQRIEIAQAHVKSGQSVEQAITALRPPVFFKYAPLMKREVSHLSPRVTAHILNLLLRMEKDLKSSLLTPSLLASQAVQQLARLAG